MIVVGGVLGWRDRYISFENDTLFTLCDAPPGHYIENTLKSLNSQRQKSPQKAETAASVYIPFLS
jgi:hypothetical protein